ncbi:MAG: hypothetical protein E2O92_05140 [Alphaproteobacteria bacterium]|nr:MAG: hypothetical protein E2O92_05140 [Alphaproteobacteria bacterium]
MTTQNLTTITPDNLQSALAYIDQHGRPIERALAQYHFGDGTLDQARKALQQYQNDASGLINGGGFGHGLEPDFLLPASSATATSIGLQYAVELDLQADDPIVTSALDYLAANRDPALNTWPATPATVNDFPHAPWWHHDPDKVSADALILNPGAELVGYFYRWGQGDKASGWLDQTIACLQARTELEAHELLCCVRLADAPNLPPDSRYAIINAVLRHVDAAIETNPDEWDGYCVKPLTAAPHPTGALGAGLTDIIRLQLPYELARQSDDGAWRPHWSWFGNYPKDWDAAVPGIAGMITYGMLMALRNWGAVAP